MGYKNRSLEISTLRGINMNLLPILAELLRMESVTKASERLHLTQSTVSGSLKQLRGIFKDDLLVQRGRGMVLTEKAKRLKPEVDRMIELVEKLFEVDHFDPETATTNFQIATADYVSALVTKNLGVYLEAHSPNISLTLKPTPGTSAKELQIGSLDLIICPDLPTNWESCGLKKGDERFSHQVFMHDKMVAIQCGRHRAAGRPIELIDYLTRPHAIYCRTDGKETIEQEALSRLGLKQHIQISVPYFTLLPQLLEGTDLISIVPESIARLYGDIHSIDVFPPPMNFLHST
ncbi:LysR family transcriptional regulator [Pseudomonas sp. C5pp]|uniref:LysR family transcriptional regulator n=1 Tax=Pseudomonas sp. C5pp TaxID=1586081 RepID=UPI00057CE897|nr:LysR family transcriptional regulator [Pseudomonas sp. C5pp]AMK37588.1 LysR-type transcriptional regulator [Pseudomonas sp. C5pp]KIC79252.1 hypothetical protein RR51_27780 [Pseudomonas sp. C5pp]